MRIWCLIFFIMLVLRVSAQQHELYPAEHSFRLTVESSLPDTHAINRQIQQIETWQHLYPDSAIAVYQFLFQASRHFEFAEGIIQVIQHQGSLYAATGKFRESMAMFRNAYIACSRAEHLWKCIPVIYNGIATVYETQGDYREAANYYYQALMITEKYKLPPPGGLYNNLGAVLMSLQQFDEALYYLDIAEQITLSSNRYPILGSVLNNKGLVWLVRKDWSKSGHYFREALKLAREQKLPQTEYMAMVNLGILSMCQEKPHEALNWLFSTREVPGNISPHLRNASMQNIGKAYYQLKEYKQAESFFVRALDTATQLNLKKRMMELRLQLSEVYEDQGRYRESLDMQKEYARLKDSVTSQEIVGNAQQLDVKFKASEKDKEINLKAIQISRQEVNLQKKNLWISGIAAGILLLSGLLVVIVWTHRQKRRLHAKQIQILQHEQQIDRLNAIMQGEEKERLRIARDLHDGIGGMLAAVKMNFTTLQHQYEQYAQAYDFIRPSDFNEIRDMLDETGNEVRKTAHNLIPDILVRHGLHEALKVYCDHINTGNQLYVNLQVADALPEIHSSFALSLYRVIQELVQNVLKHSEAGNALVQISCKGHLLGVIVKDNGKGFDIDTARRGLGLENIQFRIHALQGSISIHSHLGSGTRIEMEFNLQKVNNFRLHEYQGSHS